MKILVRLSIFIVCLLCQFSSVAAVILQYHHVSNETPKSTSISPEQFTAHMQYLKDNNFTVVPLSTIIDQIKRQQPLKDKTVAITFDDAYLDILEQATPILDQYQYPYTIFVNPSIIDTKRKNYLSWQQLKTMSDNGVLIANHGYAHDSLARKPAEFSDEQWQARQISLLLKSEKIIKERTGQNWRYFAYPYGEFTPAIQQWLEAHDFVGFSQQSGAVGLTSDLTLIPRFPVSQPYDKLASLRDKLNSLSFAISLDAQHQQTIYPVNKLTSVSFSVQSEDFNKNQLSCYVSGIGKQQVFWQGEDRFTIDFNAPLPTGRVRCNCTAPSISEPGRYYWYSKPWFILKEGGQWYPL